MLSQTENQFVEKPRSRKRTLAQMTAEDRGENPRAQASTIWTEKYAPKTLGELALTKKKIEEFIELAENPGVLVLTGAPGSGKNALLTAYASEKGFKLVRH